MRKYFLFTLSFLFIAGSLFQNIPSVEAVGEGQPCDSAELNQRCDPGFRCDQPTILLKGKCVKQVFEQCTCTKPGQTGVGNNGFTCDGKPYFCKTEDMACNPSDAEIDSGSIKDGGQIDATRKLRGVMCSGKKEGKAICKCKGPQGTDKQNFFECYKEGEDAAAMTGGGTCKSATDQCQNTPNLATDVNTVGNYTGFLDKLGPGIIGDAIAKLTGNQGYNISGISCKRPVATCRCDTPNQTGDGKNGFTCEQFGKEEKSFCKTQSLACISDPNSTIYEIKDKIFGGAPVKGIRCGIPEIPPPPSPPCVTWDNGKCTEVGTAVGNLKTEPGGFINRLFAILLSMSGGIALLLIIKSGYQLMTSQGNPEKMQNGRDQLIAAIVGLIFLIFSFVLLQVIGFDILRIPEFGP